MAIFDVLKVSTETTLYKSNTILSSILLIEKCTFKSFLLRYFIFIQSIITSWINGHCLQCTADLFNLSHNRVSCNSPIICFPFAALLRLLADKMLEVQRHPLLLAQVGDSISPRCRLETTRYLKALKDFQLWAVQSEYYKERYLRFTILLIAALNWLKLLSVCSQSLGQMVGWTGIHENWH